MKKLQRFLMICLCAVATVCLALFAACADKEENTPKVEKPEYGTIQGLVVDEENDPIEGVEVYYTDEDYKESDESGEFSIRNVKVGDVSITAKLKGYADVTKTLTEADFDENGLTEVTIVMLEGKGTIKGVVNMDGKTTQKLAGVTVRFEGKTVTTNENGEYEITDVPMISSSGKTLRVSLEGFEAASKTITTRAFDNGTAKVNFSLVQNDFAEFPGIKPYQLESLTPLADSQTVLTDNDIVSYMNISSDNVLATGKIDTTHSEGKICLNADTQSAYETPAAFVYAKVEVTDTHKFLTTYARMFKYQNGVNYTDDQKTQGVEDTGTFAKLGLYVFEEDGTLTKPAAADFVTIDTETWKPATFDLSAYAGKTVTIVLGTVTGYHCVLNRIEFSAAAPEYLTVKNVEGIGDLRKTDVEAGTFNAEQLKAQWLTGGPVASMDAGYQLNSGDPWKAVRYDEANPQPINSYIYMTTDLTAQNGYMTISATITNLTECLDPGNAQDQGPYYPYISVLLIDHEGNKIYQSAWEKIEVSENNEVLNKYYDLTSYAQENVTVVIACNVGYRATITGVSFGAKPTEGQNPAPAALEAIPAGKKDEESAL